MFNQGGFNALLFNILFGVNVYASFELDHSNDASINLSVTYALKFEIDHSSEEDFSGLRDVVGSFLMDLASEMDFTAVRDRFGQFDMDCNLQMSFDGRRYRVESVTINTPFSPGDTMIIDSKKLRVTRNGQMIGYEGQFFDIHPGQNKITYTDPATGRTVHCRITYNDRFI